MGRLTSVSSCAVPIPIINFQISDMLDGKIVVKCPSRAVSSQCLREILSWKLNGVSDSDIISRLRAKTVPPGYPIHPWKPGKSALPYYYT